MKFVLILCIIVAVKAFPTVDWSTIKPIRASRPVAHSAKFHKDGTHIIGGTEANIGAFPFQAAIFVDTYWFCGGSLISQNVILTAAHCTYGFSSFEIYLGSHAIRESSEAGRIVVATKDAIIHEDHDPYKLTNDIALLKLADPVIYTDLIKPVRLPSQSQIEHQFTGEIANVSGWGITRDGGSQSSVLLYTEVPIIGNNECIPQYPIGDVLDHMLCVNTSDGQYGPCNGDSGGPLVVLEKDGEYTEVGLVSWGADEGCQAGFPEVFTRITFFLDWIETNGGPVIRPS